MSNELASAAVGKISKQLSVAETHLQKAIAALQGIPKNLDTVHSEGPLDLPDGVVQFGHLEMTGLSAGVLVVAGDVAAALGNAIDLHRGMYARASEMGIDGQISTFGGGGR